MPDTAPVPLTVLHLSPHPDDEVIGAPATLLRLRDAGHRVVNLACSLGRPTDHERRRAEVAEACRRAGFELIVHDPPLGISAKDDLDAAQAALTITAVALIGGLGVDLVVAPSPHDGHHGHEVVGRAARDACLGDDGPRLWLWGLWADLPLPTLFVPFGDDVLDRAVGALRAHRGELERNAYVDLLRARSTVARVLGSERVFGFGSAVRPGAHAELLTEVQSTGGEWWVGAPRELAPHDPLTAVPRDRPLGWWLNERSFSARQRERRAGSSPLPPGARPAA